MHVVQFLDANEKVLATQQRKERTDAYEVWDRAVKDAESGVKPGVAFVIMREGGRVHRRHRVEPQG